MGLSEQEPATYTCAMCGETYDKEVSDEEAQSEYEAVFGDHAVEDKAIVCDDCYKEMVPDGVPYPELLSGGPTRPDTLEP